MRAIRIGEFEIGPNSRPFIVAEMSGNHNQSLDRALQIVDAAAEAGVQALKIQTYTADTMTLDIKEREFFIEDPASLWKGSSLYDLYQQAYTPWEWHKPIFERCKKHGMVGFSAPFDLSAVDFLESLDVPVYKIASFEIVDLPLVRRVARTGKPLIISTGMASAIEIMEAVEAARAAGAQDLVLLKCTSSYPATPEQTNLRTLPHLQTLSGAQVGISDHTMGVGVAVAAVALGATLIEKHFTLARADGGVDSAFSLEPHEMRQLVVESERAWQGMGAVSYGPVGKEFNSLKHRRSLYIAQDMKAGDVFTPKNLRSIRPGLGLSPKYYESFLNKKIQRDAPCGTPLSWDLLG